MRGELGGREGGRGRGRVGEGQKGGGRDGGRDGGRERERGREGGRKGGRKGGREMERERGNLPSLGVCVSGASITFIMCPDSQSLSTLASLVFEDPSPGAKAQVILQPGYVGYHGNTMGDHGDGEYMAVLGTLSLAPEVSWVTMDGKICEIFMVSIHTHVTHTSLTHSHTLTLT